MTCKNGHENPDSAKFCGTCGIPLKDATAPEKPKRRGLKRFIFLVIVVALVRSVVALIPMEDPARDVMEAIDAIGAISLESGDAIEAAEAMYESLEADQKEKVSNIDQLQDAREELERLEYQQLREEVEADVDSIVQLVVSGEYQKAKTRLTTHALKVENDDFMQTIGTAVVQKIYAEAQRQYQQENYWKAVRLLEHCPDFERYCSDSMQADAETLLADYETELNAKRPKNGEILDRTYGAGRNTFTVKASNYDVCFKLELVEDPTQYVMVYVRANESVKLNILNGEYVIKYTEGPLWFGAEQMFGPDATYYKDPETIKTAGYTSSDAIHWHNWTYTFSEHTDWGGQNMDPAEF